MDGPLTDSYQSDDDELCGGFLQAQNAAVLQRLYDPKLTQARFTGEALLAPDATRLFILKLSKWSGWSTTKFQHMEIATSHVAPYHRKLLRPRGGGLLQINGNLGEGTRSASLCDT